MRLALVLLPLLLLAPAAHAGYTLLAEGERAQGGYVLAQLEIPPHAWAWIDIWGAGSSDGWGPGAAFYDHGSGALTVRASAYGGRQSLDTPAYFVVDHAGLEARHGAVRSEFYPGATFLAQAAVPGAEQPRSVSILAWSAGSRPITWRVWGDDGVRLRNVSTGDAFLLAGDDLDRVAVGGPSPHTTARFLATAELDVQHRFFGAFESEVAGACVEQECRSPGARRWEGPVSGQSLEPKVVFEGAPQGRYLLQDTADARALTLTSGCFAGDPQLCVRTTWRPTVAIAGVDVAFPPE